MSQQVVSPRIRGFIGVNAHPEGCARNVERMAAEARLSGTGGHLRNVLVIGASTGYGLATVLASTFGAGADVLAVCLERPSEEEKTGSAGWYNLVAAQRLAAEEFRTVRVINADAFAEDTKQQVIADLRQHYGPIDLVVYSIAAPRRKDPESDTVWQSALKPIGERYVGPTIDMRTDSVVEVAIEPATDDEIANTVHVMGGEDWALWMHALLDAELLAFGCQTVAYSYVGPEQTHAIYRHGTIGRAKEHLEATAHDLNAEMHQRISGGAWVSVNTAIVTQAAAAIPTVPVYMSVLFKVLREHELFEDTVQHITRMIHEHFSPATPPRPDADGLLRLDDREMLPEVQAEVARRFSAVTTENLLTTTDYPYYKLWFEQLFGFSVPGVDYDAPTEVHRPLVQN